MTFRLILLLLVGTSFAAAHHVKGHESFKVGFPTYYVNAGPAEDHVPEETKVNKEVIEEEEKVKLPVEPDKNIQPDDVLDVKGQGSVEEEPPAIIPDGTKNPEDDEMPKDPDYKPDAMPDGIDNLKPEIPMEPIDEPTPPKTEVNLYDVCQRLGLRRFLYLMHRAGLKNLLMRPGSYRVFAPTDEALISLPYPMKARLLRNPSFLRRVLLYHIMDGTQAMPDKTYAYIKTKSPGLGLHMDFYGGQMCVNGVPLSYPSVKAGNGEIYMIDNVIGPLPVGNLAQGLQSAGIFTRLYVLAVEAGILEKELSEEGPYTLFAPTDAAFQHLPREILEWLSWDNVALKDLLLKHIAKGVFYSRGVQAGKPFKIPTLGGTEIVMKNYGGTMTVNDIPVVRADLPATNGVMHAIDEVMFTGGLQPRKRPQSLLSARRRIYPSTT